MQTVVVLISIDDFVNGREIAEKIQNIFFNTQDDILRRVKEKENGLVAIMPISDFVNKCNDEEINLDNWWVSYATINKLPEF